MIAQLQETFKLTPRQAEVASLIYEGMGNRAIANVLKISEKGVKYHATNIYRICNVRGRRELNVFIGFKLGGFIKCKSSSIG